MGGARWHSCPTANSRRSAGGGPKGGRGAASDEWWGRHTQAQPRPRRAQPWESKTSLHPGIGHIPHRPRVIPPPPPTLRGATVAAQSTSTGKLRSRNAARHLNGIGSARAHVRNEMLSEVLVCWPQCCAECARWPRCLRPPSEGCNQHSCLELLSCGER